MKIKKIRINNFKSIESFEIDFTTFAGLWEIHGPIGAGKTTLSESILFALFGKIKNKTNRDFVTWGESSGRVELWCDVRRGSLYIRRDMTRASSSLYLELDDEPVTFTDKRDAQSILETQYYDISRQAIEQLCIISFNNFHSLATMTTTERKRFIDNIFSLDVLTSYCEIINREKSSLNASMSKIETIIDTHKKTISMNESKLNALRNDSTFDVSSYVRENETLSKQIERVRYLIDKHDAIYARVAKNDNDEMKRIANDGRIVADKLALISQGRCPTCGHVIDTSSRDEYEQRRALLREQYKSIASRVKRIETLRATRINAYKRELNELTSKFNANNTTIVAHTRSKNASTKTLNDTITYCKNEIDNETTTLNTLRASYNEYDELFSIINVTIRHDALSHIIPTLNENIAMYVAKLAQPFNIAFNDAFDCIVTTTLNDTPVNLGALSTGQLKIVDMIIILATIRTIITGVNFNVYFLDELLANLDKELRDSVCCVLRDELRDDKSIFVISHASLNDDLFDGVIRCNIANARCDTFKSSYDVIRNK